MKKKILSLILILSFVFSFIVSNLNFDTTFSSYSQEKITKIQNLKKETSKKHKNRYTVKNKKIKINNHKKKHDIKHNTKHNKTQKSPKKQTKIEVKKENTYTSKDEVALYIHTYKKLPSNYITKNEAKKLGWDPKKGNLWDITDKKCIGGDKFGNYDGKLPDSKKRKWYECDIDYDGGTRNAKRIVYSNDGYIYYTDDHYKTFTKLYEGE